MSTANTSIQGDALNNQLSAADSASVIRGMGGADSLTGGAGNDVLIGDDVLVIRANATMVADILPDVRITINDPSVAVDSFTVSNTGLADYYIPFTIPAGTTKVNIIFRNGVGPYEGQQMSLTVDSFSYAGVVLRAPVGTSWVKTIHQGIDLSFEAPVVTAGDDTLDGGAGADTMLGGAGNDVYMVDDAGDVVREAVNDGQDTVISRVSYTLSKNVENLVLAGNAAINATGNELANTLTGNASNNRLDGGVGNDTMLGGAGDDTYVVDSLLDSALELGNEGNDTVESNVSFSLADKPNIENITLVGSAFINAVGNGGNNRLQGNVGDNTLVGNGGIDTLIGGEGSDYYVVDDASDLVIEEGDFDALGNPRQGGVDTIESSVDLSLPAYVENLILKGSAVEGTGNDLDNTLTGDAQNNRLTGGKGNDWLIGGSGQDTMDGGDGDDTYEMDRTDDVIIEAPGAGIDTVVSTVSVDLSTLPDVENIQLQSNRYLYAMGNGLDNVISSSGDYSSLYGMDGNDTLIATDVRDAWLEGGRGDDVYIVRGNSTYIYEEPDQGIDSVSAMGSNFYYLNEDIENASISAAGLGNATLILVGNAIDNRLTGSFNADRIYGGDGNDTLLGGFGNDMLDGEIGADSMVGGIGNDTYVVDNLMDIVSERANEGSDTVLADVSLDLNAWSEIEGLTLRGTQALTGKGNAKANTITGNAMNNSLWGGAGNDLLDGGAGDDDLYGDAGNDTLMAGQGNDVLHGSAGQDTYRVNLAGNGDTELQIDTADNDILELTGASDKSQLTITRVIAETGWGDPHANWLVGAGTHVRISANKGINGVVFDLFREDGQPLNLLSQIKLGTTVISMDEVRAAVTQAPTDGNDSLYGFSSQDTLDGGAGDDFLDGAGGIDQLSGGSGNDTLSGSGTLLGGSGNDIVSGTGMLSGGDGDDRLTLMGNVASTVMGGAGDDRIYSHNQNAQTGSIIRGGEGNDVIHLGLADLAIHAQGDGVDVISADSGSTVRLEGLKLSDISLARQWYGDQLIIGVNAALNADQVVLANYFSESSRVRQGLSIEVLDETGTHYSSLSAQQIAGLANQGNGLDNWLMDTQGNDTITGGQGQDLIQGSTGNDWLMGGEGKDTIRDDKGTNTLQGDAGDDVLEGNLDGSGLMSGGDGNDTLRGNGLMDGGTGSDHYEVNFGTDDIRRVIQDHDSSSAQTDTLDMSGITPYEMLFSQVGQDLLINRMGTASHVLIQHWFDSPSDQIEVLQAHGQSVVSPDTWTQGTLLADQVQSLVSLMAASPVPAGQLEITDTSMRSAIERAWQLTTFTGNNDM